MGKHLVWNDRYNIGVDIIDREHRKLFSILNRLFTSAKVDNNEKKRWACEEGIKYFKEHALKHFSEEETYMASIGYADFETHRRLHDSFRQKTLPELERELMRTRYASGAIDHFLGVCAGWLIGHTLTEDRAITGRGMSTWAGLLPEEQQEAIKQTIIQQFYDLFQLEAKVISDCYGGEKFGRGLYYRLVYDTEQGEKWEILLAFEEKLIVNTIGSMLGVESSAVNVMLVNAVRYTAKQLIERIREHFPSTDLRDMKGETLLTYDQFQRIFEEDKPQLSLLFNTGGKGYFAFCVIAPHLIENGIGTTIRAENAVAEIEKYLRENEEEQKQKILVVDDSDVTLHAMKKLLSQDYAVSLVKSGLSAIRSITLDRPDLIILDYEMPVCNGSQVLEMIRSEEEFADIPVIFLTGRVDRESVEKVLSLKPAGYFIKTQQMGEIKRGIDNFFGKEAGR